MRICYGFRGKSSDGFTLIELLVVLAILAVLATLVAPRYFNQIDASKETVLRENLRATREVIDRFYGDNGRYPETLDELVERHYLRSLPIDPLTESNATWKTVSPPQGYAGGVYDLHSAAPGSGRNGKAFAQW